jgi:hypothetical protein
MVFAINRDCQWMSLQSWKVKQTFGKLISERISSESSNKVAYW